MQPIENILKNLLSQALQTAYDIDADIHIETPKDASHGDLSSNIAMTQAKTLKTNPRTIAQTIVAHLDESPYVESVNIAGPGFINFFIADTFYHQVVPEILEKQDAFGSGETGQGQSVNIEYCSVNPTGSIHVGHARGAAAGDSLARIMGKAGYNVTREYYVNDAGNQIDNLAKSIEARYKELHGHDGPMPKDGYFGKEITELAQTIKSKFGDAYLGNDAAIDFFRRHGVDLFLEIIKQDLADYGVTFDVFFSEQSLYDDNEVQSTLTYLKDKNLTYEADGAIFLKTSEYGDEKDRVIVKSDGSYTYLMPDIAYHKNKIDRGFDTLINILGSDHHGYVNRLQAAIEMISGHTDKLEVNLLQIVRVFQEGEEVKMSKRSGRAITLRDLIDDAGKDAIRYFFARHSLNTHMDLDLDLAIRKSTDNPVFYAQYAHARIITLINKAKSQGYDIDPSHNTYETLTSSDARALLKWLSRYPNVIEEAAQKREVHKLANFVHTLSSSLHSFYSNVPVIKDSDQRIVEHLNLMEAVRIVLSQSLNLLGVSAPTSM